MHVYLHNLAFLNFAVVDIETTGLYHQGHGITEVAIVLVENGDIKPVFQSLVNPGKAISGQISQLTGIDRSMVENAPPIAALVPEIRAHLEGRIFLAHNVNFDYQFLKAAFEEVDQNFKYARFCTMRYARKVLPDLRTHKLGTLTKHLKIQNNDEHRAMGDAMATAKLLLKLIELDDKDYINQILKQNNHHGILPPSISEDFIRKIPESHGVYFFYNDQKKPIYIGKAKNLKKRILSHFSSSGTSRKKMLFQREVYNIKIKRTANAYETDLMEDAAIKKYWPKYNQAQKNNLQTFTVIPYQNRKDETRLAILKTKRLGHFPRFHSFSTARAWLYRSLLDAKIDPSIAGFAKPEDFEIGELRSTNSMIKAYMEEMEGQVGGSFILHDPTDSNSLGIGIIDGSYVGYGAFSESVSKKEWIENSLERAPESPVAKSVVLKMLSDEKIKKYELH